MHTSSDCKAKLFSIIVLLTSVMFPMELLLKIAVDALFTSIWGLYSWGCHSGPLLWHRYVDMLS